MTLNSIVEIIRNDPKQMHVDNDGFILTSALLDTASATTGEELSACIRVLNQIFSHNGDLPEIRWILCTEKLPSKMVKNTLNGWIPNRSLTLSLHTNKNTC